MNLREKIKHAFEAMKREIEQAIDILKCKVTKKCKPGERLGKTVWRCERCGRLFQPPTLGRVTVERVDRPMWREAA